MTKSIDVSVSIISTNERHYIEKLLPTLYDAADGISMEVILIDNNSDDHLEELKNKGYPNLYIIRNLKRLGFCKNHNIGIENSNGRYILVLNPDILFEKGESCIAKMVQFMDSHGNHAVSADAGNIIFKKNLLILLEDFLIFIRYWSAVYPNYFIRKK